MRVFKKFKSVTVCSACVSIVCFFIGIIISYIYATPTGASVVIVNIFAFLLFWLFNIFVKEKSSMKGISAFLVLCVFLVAGCGDSKLAAAKKNNAALQLVSKNSASDGSTGSVIEIKEKMFIAQTNDIYLNSEDYLGKTIKLEGLFKIENFSERPFCYVLRYGPGCCGYDGSAGFEVMWDNTYTLKPDYPKEDDWVEAIGTLKTYEEDRNQGLYIALSQITILEKRGAELVRQ
jgi:hypothetical protein